MTNVESLQYQRLPQYPAHHQVLIHQLANRWSAKGGTTITANVCVDTIMERDELGRCKIKSEEINASIKRENG